MPGEEARRESFADWIGEIADRAVFVRLGRSDESSDGAREEGATEPVAVALETLPRLAAAFGVAPGALDLRALDDPASPAPAAARSNLDGLVERGPAGGAAADRPEPERSEGRRSPEAEPELLERFADLPERFADLVSEWLRFEGPVVRARVAAAFGEDGLDAALEMLVEDERIVVDGLTVGAGRSEAKEPEICDSGNLETLLRWTRAAARPEFRAAPLERLPLFLAAHQGLAPRGRDLEDFQRRLEALFGVSAKARAWETEILPARLDPYRPSWLDGLLHDTDLTWRGTGPGRITLLFPADLELVADEAAGPGEASDEGEQTPAAALEDLFPDRRGRFALEDLADHAGLAPEEVAERLWELAWRGRVTTDSFAPVRRGILSRFRPPATPPRDPPDRRPPPGPLPPPRRRALAPGARPPGPLDSPCRRSLVARRRTHWRGTISPKTAPASSSTATASSSASCWPTSYRSSSGPGCSGRCG